MNDRVLAAVSAGGAASARGRRSPCLHASGDAWRRKFSTLVKMRSYYPGVCHPTAIRTGDGDDTEAI